MYKNDTIISGYRDSIIGIWNTTNNSTKQLSGRGMRIYTIKTFGDLLFSGSADKTIQIWDQSTLKLITTLFGHNDFIYSIAVVSKKNILISSSLDKTIKIWNLTDYSLIKTISAHSDFIYSLTILPNNLIASASRDQTIKIWDTNGWNMIKEISYKNEGTISLEVLSNDRLAVATDEESRREIINYQTGNYIQ